MRTLGERVGQRHLMRLGALVALVVVSACSSSTATQSAPPTTIPLKKPALVDVGTSARVGAAVGDTDHAMLLTRTPSRRSGIAGATIVDAHGVQSAVGPLPDLLHPELLPWSGGYAIGGARCLTWDRQGPDTSCIEWVPTVVFCNPDGSVERIVGGTVQKQADFSRFVAGGDEVFAVIDSTHTEVVSPKGFTELTLPAGHSDACRLRSGDLIAAIETLSSTDPNRSGDSSASLQFQLGRDGGWNDLGTPVLFANTSLASAPLHSCVPGGFVTNQGVVDSVKGLRPVTGLPERARLSTVAVGIDARGAVYFDGATGGSVPFVMGSGGHTPVRIDPGDRWIGMNAAGTTVVVGGPAGTRIMPVR